jgi:hypothetical protein
MAITAVYWLTVFSTCIWGMFDHESNYGAIWLTALLTLPWCQLGSNLTFQMRSMHHRGELVNIFAWFFFCDLLLWPERSTVVRAASLVSAK